MPETSFKTVALSTISALISGVSSAWVTSQLTASRSTNEKLWELRRAAYGKILAALADSERILDNADKFIDEDLNRFFNSEEYLNHKEALRARLTIIRNEVTDNYLILSDDFIVLIERFYSKMDAGDPNMLPPDLYKSVSSLIRRTRPKLFEQGRNEMPLRQGFWRRIF